MGTKTTTAAVAVALALLTGCAVPKRQVMTWAPSGGGASVPQEQALAQCSYEVAGNPANFDRLFLLSGQPKIGAHGVQGLSAEGMQLFSLCMAAKGYRQAGPVTVPN